MPYNYSVSRQIGTTGENMLVWVGNVTTGVGIANVVASSVGFAWYRSDMAAASTGTCTTGTLGTYSVSSWVQAQSTGMLGWYNFCVPNSVFVSGRSAAIRLSSAVMPELNVFIELTKSDNQSYVSTQAFNIGSILQSPAVTSAAGVLKTELTSIYGTSPVTTAAGILAYTFDLGRTANLTSTIAMTGTTISSTQQVNVNQILGSTPVTSAAGTLKADLASIYGTAPVTTAAGIQAVTWDLGRTANLTSTIALTATTISTNPQVNVTQIFGSAPVTSAAGTLKADVATVYGSAPVTTAAGVFAVAWDLGRTANLTSTISLTGTTIATTQQVNVIQILGSAPVTSAAGTLKADLASIYGSAPVTTAAGKFSVGITGTQTYDITGNLSGSVGSVTGLSPSLLDVSVSSRLATVSYTAPLSAADTRTAVGLSTASLDAQLGRTATSTQVAAIQAKTDLLVSTTTGLIDVNLKAIKESALTGDGSATPFNV